MATARVSRGRASQVLLAEWFKARGWPNASSRPASLPGTDIMGMPGLAPEVKATATADFCGALRQAVRNSSVDELPFVVYRPKSYGEARIGEWVVAMRLDDYTELLGRAGYAA